MDVRLMTAPLVAMGLSAVCVGMLAALRRGPIALGPRAPLLLGVPAALFLIAASLQALGFSSGSVLTGTRCARLAAFCLLIAAGLLAATAARLRNRVEALRSQAPVAPEEAIAESRRAGACSPRVRLIRGRIGASDQVTSPGGVVCAFYEAELRQVRADGAPGPVLGSERAAVQWLWLRGERLQVAVPLGGAGLAGAPEIRRCQWTAPLPGGVVTADGPAELCDALSFERVGRLGEPCVVLGRVVAGPAAGTYVVEGAHGGSPWVCLGEDLRAPARRMGRAVALRFAGAAMACVGAAFLFASVR